MNRWGIISARLILAKLLLATLVGLLLAPPLSKLELLSYTITDEIKQSPWLRDGVTVESAYTPSQKFQQELHSWAALLDHILDATNRLPDSDESKNQLKGAILTKSISILELPESEQEKIVFYKFFLDQQKETQKNLVKLERQKETIAAGLLSLATTGMTGAAFAFESSGIVQALTSVLTLGSWTWYFGTVYGPSEANEYALQSAELNGLKALNKHLDCSRTLKEYQASLPN